MTLERPSKDGSLDAFQAVCRASYAPRLMAILRFLMLFFKGHVRIAWKITGDSAASKAKEELKRFQRHCEDLSYQALKILKASSHTVESYSTVYMMYISQYESHREAS